MKNTVFEHKVNRRKDLYLHHDDSTPQNVTSRIGGTKIYMAINMYLHINPCPTRVQAYENKTLHMLDKTNDDEPVRVCVYYEN
jgi:hypothetical protein